MNDYYEARVDIQPCSEDATDYLASMLGDIGYESFVADDHGLTAYIPAAQYDEQALTDVLAEIPFDCTRQSKATLIPGQDWNAEWEKNYFKPIVVDGQCVIHSTFHTDVPKATYDIVIDPKMAFGTGHHATTSLIIAQLLRHDMEGKTVIDMGTGTGILAILAAMRGAAEVYGVEIDSCAYDNATDNVRLNGHDEISLYNGDASTLSRLPKADLFIANINRNVITADLPRYARSLQPGATVLFSGFYEHDIPVVMQVASALGLTEVSHTVKGDGWTCLELRYRD